MEYSNCVRLLVILVFNIGSSGVLCQNRANYCIPQPTATALSPLGFRISIPDERGVRLFAFHGALNRQLADGEPGDFDFETRESVNGEWAYVNTRVHLRPGDVLYFWIYVQYNRSGHWLTNQRYLYPDHFDYPAANQNHQHPASQQCLTSSSHGYPSNQGYPQNPENAQHFGSYPVHVSSANDRNPYQGNNDRTTDNSPATQSIFQTLLTDFVSNIGAPSTTTRRPPPIYTHVEQPVHDAPPRARPATTTTTLTGTRVPQNQVNTHPYNPFGNDIYTSPQQDVHAPSSNDRDDSSFVYPSDGQSSNNAHDRNDFNDYGNNQFTTQQTTRRTTKQATRPPTTSTSATRTTTQSLDTRRPASNEQQCAQSITHVKGKRIRCRQTLIFEENFHGRIDDRWTPDVRMPLETEDAEFVIYRNFSSVWNVTRGHLNIFPTLLHQTPESLIDLSQIRSGRLDIDQRECTPLLDREQECSRQAGHQRILPPIVSAKLRTRNSFSFKYGRVEIRAKLPKGDWLYPQLQLEPTNNVYRGSVDLPFLNGLIRVALIHGNERLEREDGTPLDGKILFGSTIVAPGDQYRETGRKSERFGQEHFGNRFHVYGVTWTPTSIQFSVDGIDYGTDTGFYKQLTTIRNAAFWERGGQMAPFDQEFHIALGVGAAGNADFPDGIKNGRRRKSKPWENTDPKAELKFFLAANEWQPTWNAHDSGLVVDYVRVYSI